MNFEIVSRAVAAFTLGCLAVGCASSPKNMAAISIQDRGNTQLRALDGTPLEAIVFKEIAPSVTLSFRTDSYQLDRESRARLSSFLKTLGPQQHGRLAIAGFADPTGSPNHNAKLSSRRARSVAQWLLDQGIIAEEYSVEGHGELFVPKFARARIVQVRVRN